MNSSIFLVFTVISLIFVSIQNVRGSHLQIRGKRMTNSQSDVDHTFKHEVHIWVKHKRDCTGTIISDKFILTAASCVAERKINGIDMNDVIEVRAGIKKTTEPFPFHVVRLVEEIYIPNFYFLPIVETKENLRNDIWDIAALKLNHRLGLGRDHRIDALNLPMPHFESQERSEENDIMFTGFGANEVEYVPTKDEYEAKDYPVYLQYSKARVFAPLTCNLREGCEEYKMCAELLHNDNAGVCMGDIGGALFDNNGKTIIGVLSYASKECDGKKPGVFTRVFPHYEFIAKAMTNTMDQMVHVASFAKFSNYMNTLKKNPWMYHWIYPTNSSLFQNLLKKLNV